MKIERQVLFWVAAVVLLILTIVVLKDVLLPFVVGLVVAYALNPITERLVRGGLSRTMSSACVVGLLVIVVVLALFFLVPLMLSQAQQLIQTSPAELERLRRLVEAIAKDMLGTRFDTFKAAIDSGVASMSGSWGTVAATVARSAWSQGLALVNFLSLLLITPLVVFYFLVDWHPMLAKIDGWLPRDQAPTIRRLAGEIDQAIAAFIRGQGLVCLMLGGLYAFGLSLAGLRYGLLIGVATGLLSFIPFAGWALGLLLAAIMALVQGWPDTTLLYMVLAIFAVGMALDSAVLSPKIVGSSIGLHPVWLIFALFVFSYLMGFVGVLVAVPLAAAIAVLVRFAIQVYLGSDVYRGHPPVPVRSDSQNHTP